MRIERNIPLARHTSLHIGGPANYLAHAADEANVREALSLAYENNLPFFILGKGSNTIFPDDGFPGVVVLMEDRTISHQGTVVTAGSGVFMRPLVSYCLQQGLRGLEELAGIPGTVGGSVRGNAGTWSTEIKDRLVSVDILQCDSRTKTATPATLTDAECGFEYRHSLFKHHSEWVILRATFRLSTGDRAAGEVLVKEDLQQRHTKQPYDAPSAGSVFKNPDKAKGIFSGRLIEQAGLKGTRIGGAQISEKHGNFIINKGKATAHDVVSLIELAQHTVQERFNVTLLPEVEIVPGLSAQSDKQYGTP